MPDKRDTERDDDHPHDPNLITGSQILAGATIPVRMDVRIELLDETADEMEGPLPHALQQKLLAQQPRLLAWLRRSPANRLAFFTDPPAAAKAAGIRLDPDEVQTLRLAHDENAPGARLPAGLELGSLRVEMGRPRGRPSSDDGGR